MTHIASRATSLLTTIALLSCPLSGYASDDDGAAGESEEATRTIILTDGQRIVGQILEEGQKYRVLLSSGGVIEIPASVIDTIEQSDPIDLEHDTHRVAYLLSPSGMMLRAGEGYIAQRELVYTAFGYGVTDFLTVEAGSVLPLWFVPPGQPTINLSAGLKMGGNPVGDLHVSFAAQGLIMSPPLGQSSVLLSGNVTYGDADTHASVNFGAPLTGRDNDQLLFTATLSGYSRLADEVGVVTEHWLTFSPQAQGAIMFNAIGARFSPGTFALDVGMVLISNLSRGDIDFVPAPLPWLNLVWGFGG